VRWREKALDQHPHRAVVTRRWILPNDTITALSKVLTSDVYGPERVSEIADRDEEWASTYASDIYEVISRFDEEKRVRKLCARLSCGVVKKVRSAAWQKRVCNRYEENAELALIIAEDVLDDIAKFKRATRKERRLLVQSTTTDGVDEMKQRADVRRSELRWMLDDAVQNLQEHCEFLREVVTWSEGLVRRDDGDEGEEMEEQEEGEDEEDRDKDDTDEESGNSSKASTRLPPPVRRSSRQSI